MAKQFKSLKKQCLKLKISSITMGIFLISNVAFAQQSRITIDAADVKNHISPLMYGSCIEDVNHEIYGGLYDQKIFGESFEEDFGGMTIAGFENFGGKWEGIGNQVTVKTDPGAKLINETAVVGDGSVEVELKFGERIEIAGLIVRVGNPDVGADNFDGYEVSLDAVKKLMVLGKHAQNWQPLTTAAVSFTPGEWNRLRVELSGNTLRLYLNDSPTPAIDYTDNNAPFLTGQVGVRTFKSDVTFRNLKIDNGGGFLTSQFLCDSYLGNGYEGFDTYGGNWEGNNKRISVKPDAGAKIVSQTPEVGDGKAEVELKFESNRDNAGLIVRVNNPSVGADSFDGYEVSVNPNTQRIILGKHRQDWKALTEASVSFTPSNWNKVRVELSGANIRIYLNSNTTPAIDYTDTSAPILTGKIGLRTWNSDVAFRNLKIESDGVLTEANFKSSVGQSGQWDIIRENNNAYFYQDDTTPFNGKYSQRIDYTGTTGKAGLINGGLNRWGIAVKSGQVFAGRVYLRSANFADKVFVALQSADGATQYAIQEISGVTSDWAKYPFTLTANATDPDARFAIWIEKPGTLWIDQAVLEGTGDERFHDLPFRADIGNAMVEEGLTYLRYGGTMVNAPEYRFKKMIGDPDLRPPYDGHWYDYSTNGFGIEEFLQFCEAAGFEAAFAINIEETATDAADMVEYLNGAISTTWGAKRAANGHPEPYNVKYIEIGNEEVIESNSTERYNHYIDRFNDLYAAMKAKDANIQFVNSAWWRPDAAIMKTIFDALNGKAAYWDLHSWTDDANAGTAVERDLIQMENLFKQWDANTTMKCVIFEENGNLHNQQRALGHATTLNAVIRHADFVLTSCQANALQPYKQNDNGWDQGQVFFTPSQVWGMPPFYAQQMASLNHLPLRVQETERGGDLDVTATRNEDGSELVLQVVNVKSTSVSSSITLNDFNPGNVAKVWSLSDGLNAENTPEEPEKIVSTETTINVEGNEIAYTFPPYSYTIIRLTGNTTKITPIKATAISVTRHGDDFVLTYPSDVTSVSIYNASGQCLAEYRLNSSGIYFLPSSHLNKGVYAFQFNSGKSTTIKSLK
ncbi:Intracellular exo-alpha-(1-_5)-L-arabinofuranosidase [termite gut metagenome]|uniref:non-reducing end alpha-L-arabinofuranosidase n=1 Tax=termite gut metagenome TaxID=433724 RepID=A0A5J4T0Z6_9ZZZZ